MFLSRRSEGFVVVLLLFVTESANAAPTISNYSSNCIYSVSQDTDMHPFFIPETNRIAVSCDSRLAGIAAEFLEPSVGFTNSLSLPIHAKLLPAVPAASFMVLIGFICVSLVKDHRVWMAALAGLLWAGQTGIQALPQLALRFSYGNHSHKRFAEVAYSNYLLNSCRPCDIKGMQYIQFEVPQSAIIKLILPTSCLAPRAEQFVCFSSAFAFDSLVRGPPIQT